MKYTILIPILISHLIFTETLAYEVDNFTNRYDPLPDSKNELNQFMNARLKKVADSMNSQHTQTCLKKDITKAVKNEIAAESNSSNLKSDLENFAGTSPNIQRHVVDINKSIYSNRSLNEKIKGFMLTSAGIDPSININGQYVGIDKLGHFLYEGYWYYDVYKNDPTRSGLKQVLNNGLNSEKKYFGQKTTGIKSYADLSANYEGFLFWNNLYGGSDPYFSCVNGKWNQIREFNWSDYVSAAWDEGINCSEYESSDLKKSIKTQLAELSKKNSVRKIKPRFQCPMSVSECLHLRTKYDKLKNYLIGPDCIDANISNPHNGVHSSQKASEALPTGASSEKNISRKIKATKNRN